jgi:hypothetical protein
MFGCSRGEAPGSPALGLTAEELLLDGERVVLVKDALRFDYLNLPELEAALVDARTARPGSNPCAEIRSSSTPRFAIVKRVVFSCARSGQASGFRLPNGLTLEFGALDLPNVAKVPVRQRLVLAPAMVTLDGVVRSTRELAPTSDDRAYGRAVLEALHRELDAVPTSEELRLAVDDEVSLGQLAEVHAALEHLGFKLRVAPR